MNNINKKQITFSPVLNTKYHIGMRVVKTALAVFVCLIISLFIKTENFVTVSSISSIMTLQASEAETVRSALYRVIGTFIGAIFGLISLLIHSHLYMEITWIYVVTIPVMIVAALYLCNVFKLQGAAAMSCMIIITMNAHLGQTVNDAFSYSLHCLIQTLIGVSVSTILNFALNSKRRVHYYQVTQSEPLNRTDVLENPDEEQEN